MEDTVEKNVEGLAEQIIVEDEQRKAEDLVRISVTMNDTPANVSLRTF